MIDLGAVLKKLLQRKWKIALILLCVAIVSAVIIVMVPRTYRSEVSLAPETDNVASGGSLSSIASSFGFDIGGMTSSDAIYPILYPDLFESTDFIVGLFDIQVETIDGAVKTDYYDYLINHQESAPWQPLMRSIRKLFKQKAKIASGAGKKSEKPLKVYANGDTVDPFMLTERQNGLVEMVQGMISCSVDRKTEVITITVEDQDPLISATMADSVRVRLQRFITDYRTSKARFDCEYYAQLADEAKNDYDEAVAEYSAYCDSHKDVILQSYISERDNLENDMQVKFNTYNALYTQLQAARAKVQETTPAFTILQNSSVPIKPDKPKRMIFVLAMTFLAFIVIVLWYVKDEIVKLTNSETAQESEPES